MTALRHVSISSDPQTSARQLGENFRDANRALAATFRGTLHTVSGYAAAGGSATLPLPGTKARAVLCVGARPSGDHGANLQVSTAVNFSFGAAGELRAFEPAGLTTHTQYDLTFLILE